MKRHLKLAGKLGTTLTTGSTSSPADDVPRGVIAFSLLERGWSYAQICAEAVERDALIC